MKNKKNDPYVETRCFDCKVRLIDTTNNNEQERYHESISMAEAHRIAKEAQLDLVCFNRASKDKLAFYKVMDYGKWKYDTAKKKKKQKQESKKATKEIRVSPLIGDHDLEHKIKQANKFLDEGDDVLFTMRVKGRQKIYADEAKKKIVDIANMCEDVEITNTKLDGNSNFSVRIVRKKG